MITTLQGTTHYEIYFKALQLTDFRTIKDAFLDVLTSSDDFSNEQKLAIRLAAEKIRDYPSGDEMSLDGALLGILNMEWDDIGATDITALLPAQRIGILEGILGICKSIILTRSDDLATVAGLNSHVEYDDETGYDFTTTQP